MNTRVRRSGAFLALAPALVWLITTFYLGSIDGDPTDPIQFELKDKVHHAIAFGLMQRTHYRALQFFFPSWSEVRVVVTAVVTASLAGIGLELWQAYLPHRSADVFDALADIAGAVLFAFLFFDRSKKVEATS